MSSLNKTYKDILIKAVDILSSNDIESPVFEAEYLLAFLLNKDRLYIKINLSNNISVEEENNYFKLIDKRKNRYPLFYITGTREFYGRTFYVEDGVLIPREETEIIIEEAKKLITSPTSQILDIGTGSGIIAVTLAKEFPQSKVFAVDISDTALKVAKKNADNLDVSSQISFIKSNLFENVPKIKFDIIASNPPYIPTKVIETLEPEVRKEPIIALDGGADGLDIYIQVLIQARNYMASNGKIILEIGYDQRDAIETLAKENNYSCYFIKDLQGYYRTAVLS